MKDDTYRAIVEGIPARGPRCTSEVEPWDQQLHPAKKKATKRTCRRTMSLDRVRRQAARAGVTPSSVTLNPDGSATVQLNGQVAVAPDDDRNEWDDALKGMRQ